MPTVDPLGATLILCEKILNEADGVISAIRMVDLFYIAKVPAVPPEQHAAVMTVFVSCKFPSDDVSTHVVSLKLTRPDGTVKDVDFGMPLEVSLADIPVKVPGAPRAFNIVAPWGVKATHMGLHRLTLFVDGEERTAAVFTLAPQPVETK